MAIARKSLIGLSLVLLLVAGVVLSAPAPGGEKAGKPALKPQTTCPVMGGGINRKLFADAGGYRIYVCCPGCITKVKGNPQKYINMLALRGEQPQKLTKAPAAVPAGRAPKRKIVCASCVAGVKLDPAVKASLATGKEAKISTVTLATLLRAGAPMVLLDARTGRFDDGRRIPGARSLSALSSAAEVAAVIPAKGTLVVTYCASLKCPASRHLAEHLRKLGYTNILEYPEGIAGWVAAGMPVKQAGKTK